MCFFNLFTDYFLSGGAVCECRVTERMTSLFYYRTPVLFPSWQQRAGFYWDTEILNNIRLQHSVASSLSLSADRSKWSSRPEWVLGDMRPEIFLSTFFIWLIQYVYDPHVWFCRDFMSFLIWLSLFRHTVRCCSGSISSLKRFLCFLRSAASC